MSAVGVDELANEIAKCLAEYTESVECGIRKAVDKVSEETKAEIKKHVTFGGKGNYVKAFRLKKTKDGYHAYGKTWYVKAPYYRLTHLLEKGHQTRGGGRTRAFKHIKYGEELAQKRMIELTEEVIRNGG